MSEAQPDGSAWALSLIAFIGSVFSPYYAWARRRHGESGVPAEAHNALNVSLYHRRPGAARFRRLWTMTERGPGDLVRGAAALQLGPSALRWQHDGSLCIDIDEWSFPDLRRVRGRVQVQPAHLPGRVFALDAQAQHLWQPVAPRARASVMLSHPACAWTGDAYLDHNRGTRPLERDFLSWEWSRVLQGDGATELVYAVQPQDGPPHTLALRLGAEGGLDPMPVPARQALPGTAWGLPRSAPHDDAASPWTIQTLESGPFYARSRIEAHGPEGLRTGVHESLSATRFGQIWVQALLPFRMPRRAR